MSAISRTNKINPSLLSPKHNALIARNPLVFELMEDRVKFNEAYNTKLQVNLPTEVFGMQVQKALPRKRPVSPSHITMHSLFKTRKVSLKLVSMEK